MICSPIKGDNRRNYLVNPRRFLLNLRRNLILATKRFRSSTKDDQAPTIADIGVCALANISGIGVEYTVGNDALNSPVNGFPGFSASTEIAPYPSSSSLR